MAYFISKRWQRDGSSGDENESLDEISLNPEYLGRSLDEVFASLVHEMCHQWQYQFGKISRVGYHNRQWAGKMEELGLMPDDGAGVQKT